MRPSRDDEARRWNMRGVAVAAAALALACAAGPACAGDAFLAMTDDLAPVPPADSIAAPVAPATVPASPMQVAPAPPAHFDPLTTTRRVKLSHGNDNVVRTGPGDGFALAGVYPKDTTFPVLAKSGDWYNVRITPTETGWVHASLCEVYDDMSDLEFRPNPKLYTRTGSYMLSGYAGAYAFDKKSNSLTLGGRLGYYLLDRLQAEVGLGWTKVNRPAEIVESLFGLSLEAEKFDMAFYDLGFTYEILPGRQMVPYVTGGAGSSIMQGRSEFTWNYGAGTMLYVSKKNAMRWEVRAYRFTSGSDDDRTSNSNLVFLLGTSLLF